MNALQEKLTGSFVMALSKMFDALAEIAKLTADPKAWGSILAVCLLVRGIKALLEAIADDDGIASLSALLVRGAILFVALTATLQSWTQIQTWGWTVAGEGVTFAASFGGFTGVGGGSGREIVVNGLGALFSAATSVYTEMWTAVMGGRTPESTLAFGLALLENVFPALMALIAALCALIFIGVLSYHVMVSAFGVAAGFVFGPVAIAFFPLLQSWTFNLIGLIAASIARLMMTLFIAGAASSAARELVAPLVRGVPDGESRYQLLLAIGVVLLLLAAGASALIGFAGQVFGNANGSMGFGRGARMAAGSGAKMVNAGGRGAARIGAGVGGKAMSAAGGSMMGGALAAAAAGGAQKAGVGAQIGGALSAGGAKLSSYAAGKKGQ